MPETVATEALRGTDKVPSSGGSDTLPALLGQEYGVDKPEHVWFLADDELVHFEGETYAIVKQWGRRTEKALKSLIETFKPTDISYEVEN
ncbi:hypothetical protein Poly51_09090 [Rubripirellula tenax]|uniref:Uncharacterized protein n=1 Tax=Rubripirellula tenax TaxID=2528015 RepID=A0A5C6FIA3_9BACT|nr:hypothetical protein [Rubripirellula tenax]TWU60630.1 hypothetical protein Poly51_09090 [Rubripirellula tenax]